MFIYKRTNIEHIKIGNKFHHREILQSAILGILASFNLIILQMRINQI